MSKIIDKYLASGNVAFWTEPRRETLLDLSGNGSVISPWNIYWKNTRKGRALEAPYANSVIAFSDTAAQHITEGTIVIFCAPMQKHFANQYLADKAAGTGTRILLYSSNGANISVYNGSSTSLLTTSLINKSFIACRYKSGFKPDFFTDGSYIGTGDTALTFTPPTGILDFGKVGSGVKLLSAIWFNTSNITDQEIAQLYSELMAEQGPGDPKTRNYKWLNNPINNQFTKDVYWTKGTGWTIANGKASSSGVQTGDSDLAQNSLLDIGSTYSLEYEVTGISAGDVKPLIGSTPGTARSADGVYTEVLKCENNIFTGLSQTARNWYSMTTLGTDVYAGVSGGDIYKQTNGTGNFVALGQTSRSWLGMTTLGTDVYASVYSGDIYKQTNGTGDFVALGQTTRNWLGMTTLGTDVYACVYPGDIYKQTNGTGDFVALGQTTRNWSGMTTLGTDVYACVYPGDIYKQTNGTGNFVALGQTTRNWSGMTTLGTDVYASVYPGDIYKQTNGTGNFVALGQTTRYWLGMTTLGTDVYAGVSGGDIYKQVVTRNGKTSVSLRANVDFVGSVEYIKVHKGNKILYSAQPEYWLPTLADVTTGKLSNTEFEVQKGSFKISESASGKKWIECVTAGVASMLQTDAYGTYVFEMSKGNDANDLYCHICSSDRTPTIKYSVFLNSSERFYFSRAAAIAYTTTSYIANLTPYKIAVSRSSLGVFTFFIKGGTFADWTLVSMAGGSGTNPTTDNTITTSKYLNIGLGAGDKFRLLNIHQGVLGIPELSAIY